MDAGGEPVEKALVTLTALGEGESAEETTDTAGEAYWKDLPGDSVTLPITA